MKNHARPCEVGGVRRASLTELTAIAEFLVLCGYRSCLQERTFWVILKQLPGTQARNPSFQMQEHQEEANCVADDFLGMQSENQASPHLQWLESES